MTFSPILPERCGRGHNMMFGNNRHRNRRVLNYRHPNACSGLSDLRNKGCRTSNLRFTLLLPLFLTFLLPRRTHVLVDFPVTFLAINGAVPRLLASSTFLKIVHEQLLLSTKSAASEENLRINNTRPQ